MATTHGTDNQRLPTPAPGPPDWTEMPQIPAHILREAQARRRSQAKATTPQKQKNHPPKKEEKQ